MMGGGEISINSCCFKIYRCYSLSLNLSNVGEFQFVELNSN